jgi:hypothetical protein
MKQTDKENIKKVAYEINKIMDVIVTDVSFSIKASESCKDVDEIRYCQRSNVKNFFSILECLIFQFKRISLIAYQLDIAEFSESEIALLKEETYELNNKGDVETKISKLKTTDNFLFSVKMLERAFNYSIGFEKNSKQWQDFLTAIKIRNRLTHPKTIEELFITDNEVNVINRVIEWFFQIVDEFGDAADKFDKKYFASLV